MIMRQDGWRGWVAHLLLPALLFVALLPRGYMPDIQALRRGDLVLTLCRVAEPRRGDVGTPAILDPLAGCPFGLLPALSAPVEPTKIALPQRWTIVAVDPVMSLVPTIRNWIIGLGPRGPPGG
ncbi:MAG: hypothetical protein ACOVN0_16170 [Niveispirillum sp.]|uniref:hypothetical protein n=1 Tax=Niveispirillum sp. TaxID=1917217 RepID=UPI003BA4FC10